MNIDDNCPDRNPSLRSTEQVLYMSDYLLTWNPNKWPLDEMQQQVEEWRTDDGLVRRWSCGVTKSIVQGDRVFLLRQGQEPRGLVGVGHCVSAVYREAHWDDDTRDANYVDVAWDFIDTEPLVSRSTLDSEEFISVHWNTQSSGIEIPSDVADKMGSLFTERITEDIETTRKPSSRHFGEIEGYSEGKSVRRQARVVSGGCP